MNFTIYNHCSGVEKVSSVVIEEVKSTIISAKVKIEKGAAKKLREEILSGLFQKGWPKEVVVSRGSEITITSVKSDIGLCLQTGNMARMYADLLKLQKLYIDGAISAAIMIVPSLPVARILGSNVTNASRLENELVIFQKVIHLPIVLIAIE